MGVPNNRAISEPVFAEKAAQISTWKFEPRKTGCTELLI